MQEPVKNNKYQIIKEFCVHRRRVIYIVQACLEEGWVYLSTGKSFDLKYDACGMIECLEEHPVVPSV
jgi:hypothetical protein